MQHEAGGGFLRHHQLFRVKIKTFPFNVKFLYCLAHSIIHHTFERFYCFSLYSTPQSKDAIIQHDNGILERALRLKRNEDLFE